MNRTPVYDPATIGIVTAAIGAVQTVGGIVQGIGASAANGESEAEQRRLMKSVENRLQETVNMVSKNQYDQMASRDVASAIKSITQAMSDRGIGGSTAAFAAVGDAQAQIQSQYSQAYLQDRMTARQSQASGLLGIAGQKPLSYNDDPYAGVFDGLTGIGLGLDSAYKAGGLGNQTQVPTASPRPVSTQPVSPAFQVPMLYRGR